MQNYLVYLTGDGDVTHIVFAKDEQEAEEFAYKWIKDHNYNGDVLDIQELTPPDEEEL